MSTQNFMQLLRTVWNENPAKAVLAARMEPMSIPAETLQYAMNMQQSFQMNNQIQDSVNAQLGAMGIFGSGGSSFGFGMGDPDQMMFLGVMGAVRAYDGNPPAAPALRAQAGAILRGQIDPLQVFALTGASIPGVGQMIQGLASLIGDMGPILRQQAIILAAMAVPREQIPALLGLPEPPKQDRATTPASADRKHRVEKAQLDAKAFQGAFAKAEVALKNHDFGRAERELAAALKVAQRTPTPDDDIKTIDHMMLLAYKSKISNESLELCVRALATLAQSGKRPNDLARITVSLSVLVQGYGTESDHNVDLLSIGSGLLDSNLTSAQRLALTLALARMLHRAGRTGEAEDLIAEAEPQYTSWDDRADIALLKADLWWDGGDRETAADFLIEALDTDVETDAAKRLSLVQKLICVWPDGRDGVDDWIDTLEEMTDRQGEPERTLLRVTTLAAVIRAGNKAEAERLAERIDFEGAEKTVPDPMKDMFRQVRESLAHL